MIQNFMDKLNENKLMIIEFEDSISLEQISYNKKNLDYCIYLLNKLSDTYKEDKLWKHYKELSSEETTYDLVSVKNQLLNIIQYLIMILD